MSKREQVLSALETLIKAIADGDPDIGFERNPVKEGDVPNKGLIEMFDGEAGDPEIILSPPHYTYDHGVQFHLVFAGSDHDARMAGIETLIDLFRIQVESDPDLGGLLEEELEPEMPEVEHPEITGGVTDSIAVFKLFCMYSTDNPLK